MRPAIAVLVLWAAIVAAPGRAAGHEFRPAVLTVKEAPGGRWWVHLSVPPASLAGPIPEDALSLAPGPGCELAGGRALLRCREGVAPGLVVVGLEDHPVDVVARVPDPVTGSRTTVLTAASASIEWSVSTIPPDDGWSVFRRFLDLGIGHILGGVDHIFFVLAMVLLLAPRWRPVVVALTAFTIAHSVTLGLSAFDLLRVSQPPVELLVAASVLLVAVEAARRRRAPGADRAPPSLTERRPGVVAFFFGLVHGLGFAGGLREIGWPGSSLVPALAGFNLGVEAGQIGVVLIAVGIGAVARRASPRWAGGMGAVATYGMGVSAAAWMFQRTIALFG